jgi:hypothetical protein
MFVGRPPRVKVVPFANKGSSCARLQVLLGTAVRELVKEGVTVGEGDNGEGAREGVDAGEGMIAVNE